MSTETKAVSVILPKGKECKGSIRFETDLEMSTTLPVNNVYVSRLMPGIDKATAVKITVEVVAGQ